MLLQNGAFHMQKNTLQKHSSPSIQSNNRPQAKKKYNNYNLLHHTPFKQPIASSPTFLAELFHCSILRCFM